MRHRNIHVDGHHVVALRHGYLQHGVEQYGRVRKDETDLSGCDGSM